MHLSNIVRRSPSDLFGSVLKISNSKLGGFYFSDYEREPLIHRGRNWGIVHHGRDCVQIREVEVEEVSRLGSRLILITHCTVVRYIYIQGDEHHVPP